MRKEVTITQLLSDIKSTKAKLDELYKKYLDPDSNEAKESQLMVTLYYPSNNLTVRGMKIDEKIEDIVNVYQTIVSTLHNYERLLIIKERVNANAIIMCSNDTEKALESSEKDKCKYASLSPISYSMTIAQALIMSRTEIKDYYNGLFSKLLGDYSKAENALAEFSKHSLNQDKIEKYVTAKLTNLNITPSEATYSNFAKEYIEANTLEILDPLNIKKSVVPQMDAIKEFYDSIAVKLAVHNATTKIWYDLETDDQTFWGYCNRSN